MAPPLLLLTLHARLGRAGRLCAALRPASMALPRWTVTAPICILSMAVGLKRRQQLQCPQAVLQQLVQLLTSSSQACSHCCRPHHA